MSQNLAMQHIGFTIQYARELEAAVRYLELMVGTPQRYMLGVPTYGRHAAYESHYTVNALGQWVSA